MNILLPLIILLFHLQALAATTEVFFSPAGDIKARIIQAIDQTETSLDIALYEFTSGDIAEALLKAKDRGIRIRLLLDYESSQKGTSLARFLQGEGLNVKYLTGRLGGNMHHSFAIFDSRKVFTGSYNWTEYAEKFNFENALFTDDTNLIVKYQNYFNELFGEREAGVKAPGPSPAETVTKEAPRSFIGISLSHLGKLLGGSSSLSKGEKDALWSHCQGEYVRGEGEIISTAPGEPYGPKVDIRDQSGMEIELLLDKTEAERIYELKRGEKVNYTGRLVSRPGDAQAHFRLDNGSLK